MMFAILLDSELGPPRHGNITAVTVVITSLALDLVSDPPRPLRRPSFPARMELI